MGMKKWMAGLFLAAAVLLCLMVPQQIQGASSYDKVLYFPLSRYPETGSHIRDAIAEGHPDICTIDRDGADKRREESLKESRPSRAMTGMSGRWRSARKAAQGLMSDM